MRKYDGKLEVAVSVQQDVCETRVRLVLLSRRGGSDGNWPKIGWGATLESRDFLCVGSEGICPAARLRPAQFRHFCNMPLLTCTA